MKYKVLIANRGEIALRILRACHELGIETVTIYSKADKDSLHVKFADESICVGNSSSAESYLNINNIISAALSTGCNAIHPGYGFLSENAKFAQIAENCNIKFIGPNYKVMRRLGDKVRAKEIAIESEIPVIPGSDGVIENSKEAIEIAQKIGYPVIIKARNGGGGRGIKTCYDDDELAKQFEITALEAEKSFNSRELYIEKYIKNPHHVEVQILSDGFGNTIHLGERDCSIQRRHQKILEESPSPVIDDNTRKNIGQAAVKLAKDSGYENAGTVEFLVDNKGDFFFIEINPRLQVEHPVTEMVTGIDIVKEQIKIAYGERLSFKQEDVKFNGHSIECRINAEDPENNFMPSSGTINDLVLSGGLGVRLDSHIYSNYTIHPYYDSLLGKLVVSGKDRMEAIQKMRVALGQFIVSGIKTNIEFLYEILYDSNFIEGKYDTSLVNKILEDR